jgi:Flp pilus assembly protein TadD
MMRRFISRCFTLFCTLILACLISCGGARRDTDLDLDGTSGATKNVEEEEHNSAMREPDKLTPLGSSSLSGDSDGSTGALECRLEGELPADVPKDADALTLHSYGQERILQKDGPAAVVILKAASNMEPKNAKILGDFATALLQCRYYDKAILNAKQAAALEPNNVDIAANLAQIYQVAGRIDEAVNSYHKAIQVSPKDPAAHNNLAVLLILSDLKEAEKEARTAVNLAPKKSTYLVNLGYILFRQQRFADAELILVRALEVDPGSADAHNQFGLILAAQKRDQEASERFRKALELRPDHMAAKENLAAMEDGFDFTGPWDKK